MKEQDFGYTIEGDDIGCTQEGAGYVIEGVDLV